MPEATCGENDQTCALSVQFGPCPICSHGGEWEDMLQPASGIKKNVSTDMKLKT